MSAAVQPAIFQTSGKGPVKCKDENQFRSFDVNHEFGDRVKRTYANQHTNQTLQYALERKAHWTKFNHCKMTMMDAVEALDGVLDESDPDLNMPNSVHAYQTAEAIREAHPDKDWFHLVGLIHDLGKIMNLYGEPQWSMTGDTYPLGCEFSDKNCYGKESYKENPDFYNEKYNTKYGIYKPNCGLDSVTLAWGHDEYMYQMLRHNGSKIPDEGLSMIRFHSFYPWHTENEYMYLCDEDDIKRLEWVREFNKYDLYSKCPTVPDVAKLKPYYQSLCDKYIPGILEW